MSTSATGGYLQLSPVADLEAVEDVLQGLIVGVTGLPGQLVRPRWQSEPPTVPERDVSWCAFGVGELLPQNFPEIRHDGAGEGRDQIVSHEDVPVLVSCYGPRAETLARMLRDGLHIPQNRAALRGHGLAFGHAGGVRYVPELVRGRWLPRADLFLTFRRVTRRDVDVLNVKSMGGDLREDGDLAVPLDAAAQE